MSTVSSRRVVAVTPGVAGGLAVLISAGLHVGVMRWNPAVSWGAGGGFPVVERREEMRRLTLESLRTEFPEVRGVSMEAEFLEAAGRGEAEGPGVEAVPMGEVDVDLEGLAGLVAVGVEEMTGMAPLPVPEAVRGAEREWSPLAEVLAVREQRVSERVDAAPRRMISRERAEEAVTDFTAETGEVAAEDFGVTAEVAALSVGGEGGRLAGMAAGRGGVEADWRPPVADDPEGGGGAETVASLIPGGFPGEAGLKEFAYGVEMTDQLLSVTAQAYVDPVRPEYRYVKVQLQPLELESLPVLEKDVFLFVDATRRVPEGVLRQVLAGVGRMDAGLNAGDRFNVLLVQEEGVWLFPERVEAGTLNIARARGRLATVRPQGEGDVFAGLDLLIGAGSEEGRPRIAVAVTDGGGAGVEASSVYLERFSQANQGDLSLFGVGVGRRVNRYLLDFLSFRNRGDSLVAEEAEQAEAALERVFREIRRPVLRHLTYRFAEADGLSVYPRSLTHLYLDRPLILVLRVPVEQKFLTFQIVGVSAGGAHDMIYRLEAGKIPPGSWSIRQDWAWQALLEEVGGYFRSRSAASRARIEALSRAYGVTVPYGLE